jgi:hypothetical protein
MHAKASPNGEFHFIVSNSVVSPKSIWNHKWNNAFTIDGFILKFCSTKFYFISLIVS